MCAKGAIELDSCGPPLYICSSTSFATINLASPIPNVGNATGANTVVTPTDFNNPIARITDGRLDRSNLGAAYQIDGGSDNLRDFNLDSTLLMVKRNSGSEYLMSFNPTTMQAALLYTFPSTATDVSFSGVNSKVVYSLETAAVIKYDFSNSFSSPTITTVHDWASSAGTVCSGDNRDLAWGVCGKHRRRLIRSGIFDHARTGIRLHRGPVERDQQRLPHGQHLQRDQSGNCGRNHRGRLWNDRNHVDHRPLYPA